MKKISIASLRKLCEERNFREFRFASVDQPTNGILATIQADLTFSTIMIALNPDIICLRGVSGMIYFRHIKFVCVAPVKTTLGLVFDIVCEDGTKAETFVKYRILAVD